MQIIVKLLEKAFPPSLRALHREPRQNYLFWDGGIEEEPLGDGVVSPARRHLYRDRLHRMDVEKNWESVG